jgi:hypothetical protein
MEVLVALSFGARGWVRSWISVVCVVALSCWGVAFAQEAQKPAAPAAPAGPVYELTAEQWREDLRFMAAEMERRHANLYHAVSRETFKNAVADLDARIPTLQRNEIIVGMMRIAAMVGDGHTRLDPRKDMKFGFPSMPLKLFLFDDGLYIRAAAPEHAALVGARIESIGGVPIDEALRRVGEISSADNAIGRKLFAPLYLNMPDILHALELSSSPKAATLKLRKGTRAWTETVPAAAIEPSWPPDTDVSLVTPKGWVDARATPTPPMWLQAPLDYHRLIALPERKALYAQINMITDVAGESLQQFGERIRKEAAATNPQAVIIDFRLAYGGNHDLRHRFIRELVKTEDDDTHLFVLTARGSFSATEALLVDLNRLTDAVFIGEPAGSKPNSYGDAYRMPLPNSGISVRTSIYFNQLAGHSEAPWTPIDIATPYTFADYVAGRDPALEAALSYKPGPTLLELLSQAAKNDDLSAVRETLRIHQTNAANRYQDLGALFVNAAIALANSPHPEAAFVVAESATEVSPRSADAWIVLAGIAEQTKRPEVALRAGKRTLELDPNNRSARSLVERLQASVK